ncbi:unnamed protein product [Vitrella brassicaformis CCMP3155]|uniref:TLDc domain-containing protein n=1 Tax=Vitrella brassicaformis (strain CCMP3155) TaxID=1169540 RepID=A0A0G4GMF0_VITBC|nr:unnamed protein product [Vitrella brassicaformis CCMP3155]|eukprot:CEM31366.1 unnamed protein product [Vitrella brassicaformis CCMP3155]
MLATAENIGGIVKQLRARGGVRRKAVPQAAAVVSFLTDEQRDTLRSWLNGRELKRLYRHSSYDRRTDGGQYLDLIRCVGDAKGLVLVIKSGGCVFGAYTSEGIKLPQDPTGVSEYESDGWHFSLAGHFEAPMKIRIPGGQTVRVAGIEAPEGTGALTISDLSLGRDGGNSCVRYCRHFIEMSYVPDGYQGARGPAACAVFGGHRDFSASDVEVLTVVGLD